MLEITLIHFTYESSILGGISNSAQTKTDP